MSVDVDIDFADRKSAMSVIAHVPAMLEREGHKQAHPSGVYLQDMPVDPFTGLSAIPYKEADEIGYFKLDFLNQSIYQNVQDEDHLVTLLNTEPEWGLLEEEMFVNQLPHIRDHFSLVQTIKPKSIYDLAVVLALMRPGKKHLIGASRDEIEADIWTPSKDGYTFKKAHSISYSALVVVQMNLLTVKFLEQLETGELTLDA